MQIAQSRVAGDMLVVGETTEILCSFESQPPVLTEQSMSLIRSQERRHPLVTVKFLLD